ncbi:MAG: serine/threonine-protein kinase [Verrucomicrobiota bacterium]
MRACDDSCPDDRALSRFANDALLEDEECDVFERRLNDCLGCQERVALLFKEAPDSLSISELPAWQSEQETLQPTLRTVLSRTFLIEDRVPLEEFPFLDSIKGDLVEGSLGNLRLTRLIGAGSMGAVFRACDPDLEREVAVKVLRPEYFGDEAISALFLDEAKAAAALKQENILPIYDVARSEEETPYFAMLVVEGQTLAERFEEGPIALETALGIAVKLGRGIEAAHEAGVLHRDIKPSNVLLEREKEEAVWITDFGLARAAHHGFGQGSLVGTRGYVAPEVEAGEEGSMRADLFSFGVLLRELFRRVSNSSGGGKIPKGLEKLVLSLTESDPDERPETMAPVVAALEQGKEELAKGSLRRGNRGLGFGLGVVAVLVLVALVDWLTGAMVVNSVIREVTGRPISIVGKWGALERLEEINELGFDRLELVIERGARVEVKERILLSGRSLRLRGSASNPPVINFPIGGETGLFRVEDGSLELEGIDLRFRIPSRQEVEAMIEVVDSTMTLRDVNVRQVGAGGRNQSILLSMRLGSSLEIVDSGLFVERSGGAVMAIGEPGLKNEVVARRVRFVGENFLQSVTPEPGTEGNRCQVTLTVIDSSLLASSPIRLGTGGVEVATDIRIENSLLQASGPFLAVRDRQPDFLRDLLRFSADGSIFSTGDDPIAFGRDSFRVREVVRVGDPKAADEFWRSFWSDTAGVAKDLTWVDWIVRFIPGRPPVWNEALSLEGIGAELEY